MVVRCRRPREAIFVSAPTVPFSMPRRSLLSELTTNIGGVELRNPILVASGIFGMGREYDEVFGLSKLGGFVAKTITLAPRAGNRPPRLYETPSGMLNSIGLANPGLERFFHDEAPFLAKLPCAVVVSIAGESTDEFIELARAVDTLPFVRAIELNLSCPNVKGGGISFGRSAEAVAEVVSVVKRGTDKPVWAKLTPAVSDIGAIAYAAEQAGADAICAVNTFPAMEVDAEKLTPVLGATTGGLSGPAIRPMALWAVRQIARAVSIPVVGIGGITSVDDVVKFLAVGASAVQVGSALFGEPYLAAKLSSELDAYLKRHNISSVAKIIGALKES